MMKRLLTLFLLGVFGAAFADMTNTSARGATERDLHSAKGGRVVFISGKAGAAYQLRYPIPFDGLIFMVNDVPLGSILRTESLTVSLKAGRYEFSWKFLDSDDPSIKKSKSVKFVKQITDGDVLYLQADWTATRFEGFGLGDPEYRLVEIQEREIGTARRTVLPDNCPAYICSEKFAESKPSQNPTSDKSLPPCPETGFKHNCFGTITFSNGDKYVGEFRNNKINGLGIEYRVDGSMLRSGRWEGYDLVQSFALDSNSFPFNPPSRTAATQLIDPGKAERDRLAAEVETERKRREELEKKLAEAEAKEREQRTPTPQTQVASPRNPHALIIGNAAYPGSARLDNPINDANAVAQKLKTMGFTVTVVTDANRQRLVQAMSNFRKTASSADLSLLFYSGHGVQIFGTNYILPTDADQSDVAQATIQGVSLNSVVENFLPGKIKIVFLDACRDNPLQRTGDRTVSKGLAPISVAQGTLIAYATKDGQTASDGVGQKNSPFTKALLEHLSDPQDIAVILRKVREKVMTATGGKQQPSEYGSLTGGELVLSGAKR